MIEPNVYKAQNKNNMFYWHNQHSYVISFSFEAESIVRCFRWSMTWSTHTYIYVYAYMYVHAFNKTDHMYHMA